MGNGNVSRGNLSSKCHTLKIWQIARKGNGLYFPGYMLCLKLLKLDFKKVAAAVLEILTSVISQSAPNDIKHEKCPT